MAKTDVLSVRLTPQMREKLEFIAESTQRSVSVLGSQAVQRFIEDEAEIVKKVQEAQAEAKAGRVISHDEAMRSMKAAIAEGARRSKSG